MKNGKRVRSGEALPSRVTAKVVRASGLSLLFLALLLLGHSFPPCHLYRLGGFKSSEAWINGLFCEFYKKDGMRERCESSSSERAPWGVSSAVSCRDVMT